MSSDIKFYFELLKKRLPVMVVIFMLCAAVGVGLAMTLPAKYRATASLLVEGAQLPDTLFTPTVQTQAAKELQAIELRLMTRSNLIDIAAKHRVFDGANGMSPDDVVNAMRSLTQFELTPGGRNSATILRISFEGENSKKAADVVNEFVTLVLRADVDRRTGESGQTLEFFQQRVERLTARLAEQSAEIVAFKEANNDALPEGLQFRLDRQSRLQERLNLTARDRTTMVEQRNRLAAVGEANGLQGGPMTPQQQELNRLETEIRSKLAIHAPDSPTIQFLQKRVDILKSSDPLTGAVEADSGINAVLDLQLAEVDSRIAALDEEAKDIEAELNELADSIRKTSQVTIQLDKLEREYENTQTQYNSAVASRSTAEQGVDVEVSAKGERVALIERASAPVHPTSPNRKLIAGGGVFAGTALATLFFVMAEMLNRTVRRPVDLARGLGIQPLATIPFIEENSVRRRRRILKILFILAVMVSVPLALWAIHTYYLPLDLLVEKVMERAGL